MALNTTVETACRGKESIDLAMLRHSLPCVMLNEVEHLAYLAGNLAQLRGDSFASLPRMTRGEELE